MFNIDQIVKALQSNPEAQRGAATGAAGLAAGMLFSGGGGKLLGSALRMGTLAAVGGLAYNAWQKYQQDQQAGGGFSRPAPRDAFIPGAQSEGAQEELGKSLVRAMISAAKADGRIDAEERERIFTRLEGMTLSAEEKAWVFDELSTPLDLSAVASRADTPEHAAEIYAASLVAMRADTAAERAYLETLAAQLGLEPGLVSEIHAAAEAAASAEAASS